MNDPRQLAFDILELRAYARAKDAIENAQKQEDVPDSPMVDWVFIIQSELSRGGP